MRLGRYVVPAVFVLALVAADALTRAVRRAAPAAVMDGAEPARRLVPPAGRAPVPTFAAIDIDGRDASPTTWRGRVVVVNFWATWCGPCRVEMPALARLQERYRDTVLVIGVLQDDAGNDAARAVMRSLGVHYPVVRSTFDIEHSFAELLAFPTTYLVDRAGRIAATHVGQVDEALLTREVEILLAEPVSRAAGPEWDRASRLAMPGSSPQPD